MWSCFFNKCTQLHEGFWNIKIFFGRENGWPHTAALQWCRKRKKPENVCNLNFSSLKQQSFFLFPYFAFSCKCIMLTSLTNLSMFLGINAGTEVLHAEFRESTFLFLGESYAGNETVLAFAVSCLSMCLCENWKATLIVMVSLEMSSEFGQDWKSSWRPHPSEFLRSEYKREELKYSVLGEGSVCKGHSVKNIKERIFFPT